MACVHATSDPCPNGPTAERARVVPLWRRSSGLVLLVTVFGALLVSIAGCAEGAAATRTDVVLRGTTMGSTWSATVVRAAGFTSEEATEIRQVIEGVLDDVDQHMSTWKEESELSRFNRAPAGEGVELSDLTWSVIDESQRASLATGGAFDPTVAALVRAYGFGGGHPGQDPNPDELERLRGTIGLGRLVDRRPVLDKEVDGLQLDFSAIAPGFAADRIGDALRAAGVESCLIDVGGEFRAFGERPGGGPWRVAIEDPREPDERRIYLVIALSDGALATSGDYRNIRVVDGVSVPHLFDPRAGAPIASHVTSASVLAPTCAQADALATAMAVVGGAEALVLAEKLGIEVFVLEHGDDGALVEFESPGFARCRIDAP